MDANTLGAFASVLTALAVLVAGVFAIYKFNHTESTKNQTDVVHQWRDLAGKYQESADRFERENINLRRQNDYLQQELFYSKSRNVQLTKALSQASGVPEALIEMRLDQSGGRP